MTESYQMNIAQLLQMTLVANTHQIRQAEQKLRQLHSDPNFIIKLMGVPRDNSVPYNIRKAAILYTLTYCKNIQLAKKQQQLTNISKYLFTQLGQSNLQLSLRKHLVTTLSFLVTFDKNSRIKSIFYQQTSQAIQKVFLNLQNLSNFNEIIFVGLAVQTVLTVSIHSTKQLVQFIRNSFIYCVGIAFRMYEPAQKAVHEDSRENLLKIFNIMRIYSLCIKMFLKKIAYTDIQTVRLLFQQIFCQLLSKIWQFTLKQNSISDTIIYYTRKYDNQISQHFHNIKADYLQVLTTTMRTVFQYYKDPKILSTHPIIKNKEIIIILLNSIYRISLYCPHYNIRSPALVKLIEEMLNCLLLATKSNYYYDILVENKVLLIQQCIFKILDFSADSYELLQSDPEEFINQVFQIIDMDPTQFINNRKKQFEMIEASADEIQDHTTLRTVAATLLNQYCKNIDGTLSDIFNFIYTTIKNGSKCQFSISTLILVLGILRDQILENQQQSMKVIKLLIEKLQNTDLPQQIIDMGPHKDKKKNQNVFYLLTLLCIYKYICKQRKDEQIQTQIQKLDKIIVKLIESQQIEEGVRLIAYDIVGAIIKLDQKGKYTQKYINMIKNLLLQRVQNTSKKLQILYNIFKFKDDEIIALAYPNQSKGKGQNIINDILDVLCLIIIRQIDNQLQINKSIICKCWNVISDICQNENYITYRDSYVMNENVKENRNVNVLTKIQEVLYKLSAFIDGKNDLQFDEDIITCVNSLITQTKTISQAQTLIFSMISRLFSNKYLYKFQSMFQTIVLFLKYGGSLFDSKLETNLLFQNIIQMSIKNMNRGKYLDKTQTQTESVQGILILENVMINYGSFIQREYYQVIIRQVYTKLKQIQGLINKSKNYKKSQSQSREKQRQQGFLLIKSNLISCLSLALASSYKYFSQQNCQLIIREIITNFQCVKDSYSKKIFLITLTDIFVKPELGFVRPYLAEIMAIILKLTKSIQKDQNQSQNIKGGAANYLGKQYNNCMAHIKNGIQQINQVNSTKQKIIIFKEKYAQIWQSLVKQLNEQDRQSLKQLMGRVKINNQSRQIFKIKR